MTEAEITELAPDAGVLQRARKLALPTRWLSAGASEGVRWGQCQGSGKGTYAVAIDLDGPAYRCSCPSRQFPCKHALGLLLLAAQHPAALSQTQVPADVAAWLQQRAAKAHPSIRSTNPLSPTNERLQQRLDNLAGGLIELRHWLHDALRGGLADLAQQPPAQWDRLRARLIDAQAPGLATRIEALQEVLLRDEASDDALEQLALLYLYQQGFDRYADLSPALQAEYQQQAGIALKKQEVLQQEGVSDHWLVLGRRVEVQERIDVQRTWLQGLKSGRVALLLDFAVGNKGFDSHLNPGQGIDAELCYYPGLPPLRALAREGNPPAPAQALPQAQSLNEALTSYAQALGENPFLLRYPLVIRALCPVEVNGRWALIDAQRRQVPLHAAFQRTWELLALSGGQPITLMGEWDGQQLFPLGAREGQRWVRI